MASPSALIFQKIPAIMSEIDAISKDRKSEQGYKFRGIDDVLKALKPVLSKHKVFILPKVVAKEREIGQSKTGSKQVYSILTVEFTICAEDGSSVQATMVGEAQDTGDKSSNKAMSAAFKYMAFQLFCIPTDDEESDSEWQGIPEGLPVRGGPQPIQPLPIRPEPNQSVCQHAWNPSKVKPGHEWCSRCKATRAKPITEEKNS